jgi:hypothetical protein
MSSFVLRSSLWEEANRQQSPNYRADPDLARTSAFSVSVVSFLPSVGVALGVSTFVLAATVGGFRLDLLLMIAVSAGTFRQAFAASIQLG